MFRSRRRAMRGFWDVENNLRALEANWGELTLSVNIKGIGIPPETPEAVSTLEQLAEYLAPLIGVHHSLIGEPRTVGSALRRRVSAILMRTLPPSASPKTFVYSTPPRKKGMVSIRREWVDTYMVTPETTVYNLQIWNRDPLSVVPQVIYENGKTLSPIDVRYVLVKIDRATHNIVSIAIMTPEHIASTYGPFGKPTWKYQARIPASLEVAIAKANDQVLVEADSDRMQGYTTSTFEQPARTFRGNPEIGKLLDIRIIAERIKPLVGSVLPAASTKVRGQCLEKLVATALGYVPSSGELGEGGYPDIRNQALEVKVQEKDVVDLGENTTTADEEIFRSPLISTRDIRYCVAITHKATLEIEGFLLVPGARIEHHLTYGKEKNFKKQRTIPMSIFDSNHGTVTINP